MLGLPPLKKILRDSEGVVEILPLGEGIREGVPGDVKIFYNFRIENHAISAPITILSKYRFLKFQSTKFCCSNIRFFPISEPWYPYSIFEIIIQNQIIVILHISKKSPSQPHTARGFGERCKLPNRGLGLSPSRPRFWCILDRNGSIWCYII